MIGGEVRRLAVLLISCALDRTKAAVLCEIPKRELMSWHFVYCSEMTSLMAIQPCRPHRAALCGSEEEDQLVI